MSLFTSMGAQIGGSVSHVEDPSFRISSEIYLKIGSLLSESGIQPKYAQLHIYDVDHEVSNWLSVMKGWDSNDLDCFHTGWSAIIVEF